MDIDTNELALARAAGGFVGGGITAYCFWVFETVGNAGGLGGAFLVTAYWAFIGAAIAGGVATIYKANSWSYDEALDELSNDMSRAFG